MGDEVIVIAKYDYSAQDDQELDIKKNEKLVTKAFASVGRKFGRKGS